VLWTSAVIIGSSISASAARSVSPLGFEGADKVVHFVAYCGMVFLWNASLRARLHGELVGFASCVMIGLVLEICQRIFFESRSFEIMDIIANIMGAIVGLLLFRKFSKNQTYVK